ncbi:MAG: hypothetical protein A2X22_05440 [Bacteroidetes bacterium GWF2_49_14]|nr:MAG: hypothetical protein A2X22_05440 [Bacteroidetes bacterium GWF2_49_14]HBB93095.1 hypothetical protein [Bacteroidales bacterium]
MNIRLYILSCFLLGAYASGLTQDQVTIQGKIVGFTPSRLEYVNPINGFAFPGFRETISLDSSGNFRIQIPLKEPGFILIYASMNTGVVIAEPGESYHVVFEQIGETNSFRLSGPNEDGQNHYNTLPSPYLVQLEFGRFGEVNDYQVYAQKVNRQKAEQLGKFKELLDQGKISDNFYQNVLIDRNCYYSTLLSTFPLIKLYRGDPSNPSQYPMELKHQWKQIWTENPPTDPKNLLSPRWYEYAKYYIEYQKYLGDSVDIDAVNQAYKDKLVNTHQLTFVDKYFSAIQAETYTASLIYEGCLQKKFEKEWLELFDRFKSKYPKSMANPYLKPMVSPVADYYKTIRSGFTRRMKFIDQPDQMKTLDECLSNFRGKRMYIDVWATWCGPCKDEFKYKDALKAFLKKKGFEVLYISIDKEEKDEQWKEMIKYYGLEGYHIRARQAFCEDLTRIFDQKGSLSIPWYLIIDESGKIISKDASRPSNLDALKKEMKKLGY